MEEINVELGERSYRISLGAGILGRFSEELRGFPFSRISLISNPTVYGLYGGPFLESLREISADVRAVLVPDGEEYKEILWAYYLYGELLKQKFDRASALIALGGGVIGDLTGFVASTYMRGISFVQVPTTLLAQVDSSVGGKTGVNHPLGKNMIGTFYQPQLVWTDVNTLKTLPRREFLAGIAEIIKYGVIRDKDLFRYLEDNQSRILNLDSETLVSVIKRSCEIKADVVSRDEREGGLRAILNFGHTFGHAIETATGYTRYLHGEAVAIGMHLAARLSSTLGLLDAGEAQRITSLIRSFGLPTGISPEIGKDRILSSMELDKKAVKGDLRFVLPETIGSVRVQGIPDSRRLLGSLMDTG